MSEEFEKERKLFETWFKAQFGKDRLSYKLKRERDNSYSNDITTALFIGFCAGANVI